jgi:hypothetical protein
MVQIWSWNRNRNHNFFKSGNRNRNHYFSKVGTGAGTVKNSYGSTTLVATASATAADVAAAPTAALRQKSKLAGGERTSLPGEEILREQMFCGAQFH